VTLISHAQNFEDVILWRALHDVKNGRYIDVGAHDPFIDSVSLAFYEAGWRGVSVEPTPFYAAKLREARPGDEIIEAAVDEKPGPIPFYELSGLSSGRPDVAQHHARAGHRARKIFVTTVRLEHILTLTNDDVHWLKIDVEGMEAPVLRSWGDCSKRPWILVVEATFPNTQEPTHHLWIDEVLSRGYEKAFFDGLSCYFVHKEHRELAGRIATPANVFDAFSITSTHFAAKLLREDLEGLTGALEEERRRTGAITETLDQTRQRLEVASQEQFQALERLAASEDQHRQALADATERSRVAGREAIEAQVELARFHERCAQLEERLVGATQSVHWAEERASRSETELKRANDANRATGLRLAEIQQELSGLRQILTAVEAEREAARVATERLRAESDLLIEEQKAAADRVKSELSDQLERYRGALERARLLIRGAAMERSGIWYRLGRRFGLAGQDSAWHELSSWSIEPIDSAGHRSIVQQPTSSESKVEMNVPAPSGGGNPYIRAESLAELLSWNGVDFVRCAYVTILGRQPDAEGERYYTDRVGQGYSKLEILWQLRRSSEGAAHDPGIAGFDRALRRARLLGWPARALRRLSAADSRDPSGPSDVKAELMSPVVPEEPTLPAVNSPNFDAIAAEIQALKQVIDGFGHALRGVSNAQARFDGQLRALSTSVELQPSQSASRQPRQK
jgi:FkbM family methyltransferase